MPEPVGGGAIIDCPRPLLLQPYKLCCAPPLVKGSGGGGAGAPRSVAALALSTLLVREVATCQPSSAGTLAPGGPCPGFLCALVRVGEGGRPASAPPT